ncbi:MAG: hypothetical protein LBS83_00910 [Holosporales bacterium]|jgi:hypothetical protein|nr:hypothetical protein [Holosporales bacterium]
MFYFKKICLASAVVLCLANYGFSDLNLVNMGTAILAAINVKPAPGNLGFKEYIGKLKEYKKTDKKMKAIRTLRDRKIFQQKIKKLERGLSKKSGRSEVVKSGVATIAVFQRENKITPEQADEVWAILAYLADPKRAISLKKRR